MPDSSQSLDNIDRLLLTELQRDADRSLVELGELVGLSPSAASRRISAYKRSGTIRSVVALVDPAAARVALQIVCQIQCVDDSAAGLGALKLQLIDLSEVVQCYEIAGVIDLIVVFAVPTMQRYNVLTKQVLQENPTVLRFESHVVIDSSRPTPYLPVK